MIYTTPQTITLEDLASYCTHNWSDIYKEKLGSPGGKPDEAARFGYDIYSRSRCSSDMDIMIIGPNRIRQDRELVSNVGCVIGKVSKRQFKKLNTDELYQIRGAILGEKQWSGFINDLYMLGGVHARKVFHFSIEEGRTLFKSDVWDPQKNCLNTTGRELLLLKMAGYKKVTIPSDPDSTIFGHVFVPPSKCSSPEVSLKEYRKKIYKVRDYTEVLSLFKNTVERSPTCSNEDRK